MTAGDVSEYTHWRAASCRLPSGYSYCLSSTRGGQRRRDGLVALVLGGAGQSRPVQALLLGVAGQHAEPTGTPVETLTSVSPDVAAWQT